MTNDTQRVDVERLSVSVERFRPVSVPSMEPHPFGAYVRHSDYAALLQQFAELEAEVERLRAQHSRMVAEAAKSYSNAEAAERDRQVAVRAVNWYADNQQHMVTKYNGQWFAVVGNRDEVVHCHNGLDAVVAAFLAANGGRSNGP